MTVTTAETLTVNGVILNTLAKNIESLTGRLQAGSLRTDNIAVPGRHGSLRTTRKYYDEGQIILPMWVRGCDDDGLVPSSSSAREEFFANVDALSKLFRPGSGTLEVLHTLADGSVRRAVAECTEVINFAMNGTSGTNPLAKFSVALRVPSVFWEDEDLTSVDLAPAFTGAVGALDGTTAPIDDATIVITGPATNPKIEALLNGATMENPTWVLYSGTIAGGQTLTIDCSTWTLTGGGGFTPNYANLSHQGGARWLTIAPGWVGNPPELKFTASSTSGATKATIQARRKFLVG